MIRPPTAAIAKDEKSMNRSASNRRGFKLVGLIALIAAWLPFGIAHAQSAAPDGLTVHTLDTTIGQPAAGLAVELFDVSGDQPRSIVKAVANSDGRADIVTGRPLPAGRYELQFAVADYFRKRGTPLADPPFLDIVPVRFFIDQPAGNLHVPFAFSPWSYGVFR